MPGRNRGILALALLAATILAACGGARTMPAPGGGPALKVLAFYDDRAESPRGTILPLIAANKAAISDLAPLWYHVMADGTVRDTSENDVKTFAKANGIKLMPLVINGGGTSGFLLNAGDCTSGPCAKAVDSLATILRQQGYDGLNIDFELLKDAARPGLVAFMARLHKAVAAQGKTLTIDVIPAGSQRQAQGAYNFPALAKDSDEVVLMTYDAHDDTSAPGAVAPLAWVKKRLRVALNLGIPRNKLILGLADYGYDWSGAHKASTIGLNAAQTLIQSRQITVKRTADGSPHFNYTKDGSSHTVWFEDGQAIGPKIQLARQNSLKGLALWMAGYETADYWKALRTDAGTAGTLGGLMPQAVPSSTTGSSSSAGATLAPAKSHAAPPASGTSTSSATSRSAASGSSPVPAGGTTRSRS